MNGQVVWIEKRYYRDLQVADLALIDWTMNVYEPEDWEKELFDKVVIIPLED